MTAPNGWWVPDGERERWFHTFLYTERRPAWLWKLPGLRRWRHRCEHQVVKL